MHDIQEHLADVVRNARLAQNLTQEQLAEALNFNNRTILTIESGHGNPKFTTLHALVTYLQMSADTIFYPNTVNQNNSLSKILRVLNEYTEAELDIVCPVLVSIINELQKLVKES